MTAKVYVEGGGSGRALRQACREAFSAFFRKAGFAKRMPAVVACGSRNHAYEDFRAAIVQRKADFVALLVDSEGPVNVDSPWNHLRQLDGWERPAGATDKNAHLMVQMMESWFLADRDRLASYFGAGFRASALPAPGRDVEDIAKADLEKALRDATRQSRKGRYAKGRHSFALLGEVDATKVINASPYARRLVETISNEIEARR